MWCGVVWGGVVWCGVGWGGVGSDPLPWTPLRRTRPKFRAFFSLSRPVVVLFFSLWGSFRVFFSLSGGLLVEFWWCFGRLGPSNVRIFALGLSCETPAA